MMEYSLWLGVSILLALVPLALVCVYGALRFLDRSFLADGHERKPFKNQIAPAIARDPLGAALYFGLRFVGVCYLVGSLFNRVI